MNRLTKSSIDQLAMAAGLVALVLLIVWLAGFTGFHQPSAAVDAIAVLITSGPYALAWLAAAIGLGWPLQIALAKQAIDKTTLQVGLGVAAMLALDQIFGALGWLQIGGGVGGWVLIIVGVILLIVQFVKWARCNPQLHGPPWLVWCALPAIAVLSVASCSAPGWLWATEFGGYDALSYHLQLPKEWLALGRIEPLQHNVYSFLPGYVEGAYYHLAVLMGDGVQSVYASQMLHAGMALMAAFAVGRLVSRWGGALIGCVAAVLLLGTPWVVVVGSLGYNEMAVLLMLAVGMIALHDEQISPAKQGIIVGMIAAAACGAKLTAVGFVAAPLAAMMLMTIRPRHWLAATATAVGAGITVLLPYLLRNQSYAANPVFPFATNLFGLSHWSAEQVIIWKRGHTTDASLIERVITLWNEVFRYGIGTNPDPSEPWKRQWSFLPWLAVVGVVLGLTSQRSRRIAVQLGVMLLIQFAFWISVTHLKSRFMLPAAITMVLATMIGVIAIRDRFQLVKINAAALLFICVSLVAWCSLPVLIFFSEANRAPAFAIGRASELSGDRLAPQARQELGATTLPAVAINHLLSANAKTLAVGYSIPLYVQGSMVYQTTWDRGRLSHLMRQFPEDHQRWVQSLREEGFTHLLIDETMLRVWEESRWNDPLLTAQRVRDFADAVATPQYWYPNGVTLYQLSP